MTQTKTWAILATTLLLSLPAQAAPELKSEVSAGTRESKKIGLYLGVVSEPYPSILSLNIAYNLLDHLRLNAGAGTLIFGSSYGIGAKYLFSPASSFSPILGLSASRTRLIDFISGAFGGRPSPDDIVWSSTLTGGVDWQAQNGFYLEAGLNWMWFASPSDIIGTRVLPYLNVGLFF